jgi:lipopolysaccharide transport system ATP-binding protein
LLKILSRVTSPTTGEIKTKGRIASLLEVGTGFHPEMTGRENIYLNGAILGMTKAEIRRKEDEIINFSGCERYIDTPVKRYSSGMTVRLAFAVAAHLEPDILVIDEVLAVGDAEFQKKAVGKMQDISQGEGRTVLFVSHNMAAVKSLCTRAMVLEHGKVVFEGGTDYAVSFYLKGGKGLSNHKIFKNESAIFTSVFQLHEIGVKNTAKKFLSPIVEDEQIELSVKIDLMANQPENYHITYHLTNDMGEGIFSFSSLKGGLILKKGYNHISCYFPEGFLQSGDYYITFFIIEKRKKAHYIEKDIVNFTVVDAGRELGVYLGREPGYIRPNFKWNIND